MALNTLGRKERTDALNYLGEKIFSYKQSKTFWFNGGADVFLNDSLQLKLNTDKKLLFEYIVNPR